MIQKKKKKNEGFSVCNIIIINSFINLKVTNELIHN